MVAYFWLEGLEQVFKQFAKTDDTLRVAGDGAQITEIFAIEGSVNEIAVLFVI